MKPYQRAVYRHVIRHLESTGPDAELHRAQAAWYRRLLLAAVLLGVMLVVTGCPEVAETKKPDVDPEPEPMSLVMDEQPPSRPADLVPPPRAELVGRWKIGSPPYWPDVDFVVELRADGTGVAERKIPGSRSPLHGNIRWELISSRYGTDDLLKYTGGHNGQLDMERYIHRVDRDTICIGYCAGVMQRIK